MVAALSLCGVLSGCNDDDARTVWSGLGKACGSGDLGATFYAFGPRTGVGPGSVWESGSDGRPRLLFEAKSIKDRKSFTVRGAPVGCKQNVADFGWRALVSPDTTVMPVGGAVIADLKKATGISATAHAIIWDTLGTPAYGAAVHALPQGDPIRRALLQERYLVATRALRVEGFSVTLHFNPDDAAALKPNYNGPINGAVAGNIGGTIMASWSSTGDLTLTATKDFYVAVELTRYKRATRGAPEPRLAAHPATQSTIRDARDIPFSHLHH
jgi:hypothetical protein